MMNIVFMMFRGCKLRKSDIWYISGFNAYTTHVNVPLKIIKYINLKYMFSLGTLLNSRRHRTTFLYTILILNYLKTKVLNLIWNCRRKVSNIKHLQQFLHAWCSVQVECNALIMFVFSRLTKGYLWKYRMWLLWYLIS